MADGPLDYRLGVDAEAPDAAARALGDRTPCVRGRGRRPRGGASMTAHTRRELLRAAACIGTVIAWALVLHLVAP
jgi:hypothetical protein